MAATRHSYIKFYPSDWIAGTARLNYVLRSIYFDVCLWNWDKVAPMPKAEQALQFGEIPGWQEQVEILIAAGKIRRTQGGGLVNERALNTGRTASERWSNASAAGKEGAAKRWGNKGNLDSEPYSNPNAEPEPEPEPENPPTPQGGETDLFGEDPPDGGNATGEKYPAAFEQFWSAYPNKTGKRKASAAFAAAAKRIGGGRAHEFLLASVVAQAVVWRAKGVEGRFIPHPTTWLNQGRYDDPAVAKRRDAADRPDPRIPAQVAELSPAAPVAKRDRPLALQPVGWTPGDGDEG